MTPPESAVRHVVARCPTCGVEHGTSTAECDACHTPLRPWCRVHGREAGWLDAPACPRCVEAATRAAPHRPTPPPAVPRDPAPAPASEPSLPRVAPRRRLGSRPRRTRADEGLAEPPPPPRWGFALVDTLGFSIGGAVVGIVLGPVAAGPSGVEMEVAARTGLVVMGIAGLAVGLIRVVAIARADQRRREG